MDRTVPIIPYDVPKAGNGLITLMDINHNYAIISSFLDISHNYAVISSFLGINHVPS